MNAITRRSFVATAAISITCLVPAAAHSARLVETKVISHRPEFYHGFPTIARRGNGDLWLAWSGEREKHVDPYGKVMAMKSSDDGATWSEPRVIFAGPFDNRDCGVVEAAQGTLLVTFVNALGRRQRGVWALRSDNGGETWSGPLPTMVHSPHGPIQLQDGRLLYAGRQIALADERIGVAESRDDGLTWRWYADIPTRRGDNASSGYHELHAVECADGMLIAQIRNHNAANFGESLQCESSDGGKSWTAPHSIGVWGLPPHLLRLRDGRLVMTYGHRRKPFGNQARISADCGRTWGNPITISADGSGWDLGYPSTVELSDGALLSVWYETMSRAKPAVLRQAKWQIG